MKKGIRVLAILLIFTLVVGIVYKGNVINSNASENIQEAYDENDYEVNPEDNVEAEDIEKIIPTAEKMKQ